MAWPRSEISEESMRGDNCRSCGLESLKGSSPSLTKVAEVTVLNETRGFFDRGAAVRGIEIRETGIV
jgi:hypothetical protein